MVISEYELVPGREEPRRLTLSLESPPAIEIPADAPVVELTVTLPSLAQDGSPTEKTPATLRVWLDEPWVEYGVRSLCRDCYAMYGWPGVTALENACEGATLKNASEHQASGAFERMVAQREELEAIGGAVLTAIEEAAVHLALDKLALAEAHVVEQAVRYFPGRASDRGEILRRGWSQPTTPDHRELESLVDGWKRARPALEAALRAKSAVVAAHSRAFRQHPMIDSIDISPGDITRVSSAQAAAAAAWEVYARALSVEAGGLPLSHRRLLGSRPDRSPRGHPVLHRIIDADLDLDRIVLALRKAIEGATLSVDDGVAIGEVSSRVWNALKRCTAAIGQVRNRVSARDGQFDVWRYPALVEELCERLGVPDGTVERRAIDDRLVRKEGMSLLSAASIAAGVGEVVLSIVAAPAAVLLIASSTSFILGATESVRDLKSTSDAQADFDIALNPAESFGVEPSWAGVVAGAVLNVIGMPGR
ncbi:MAG: hypothetical protein IT363_08405 [Methanoregulaceae archaeon]|nr:hypothetical protein [Methanoregulaceae archaeon]